MIPVSAYAQNSVRDIDEILDSYAPVVKRIAYHLLGRLPPGIQLNDLIQVGMIGLIEAARNYSTEFGANFTTYASIRIRGAMLDEVRRNRWLPRSVQHKGRQLINAIAAVEKKFGREANDDEIINELGISLEDYHRLLQELQGERFISYEEINNEEQIPSNQTGNSGDLSSDLEAEELRLALTSEIAGLPEREKLVISLYYNEELNLREIGEVLGVSESRVCQIHSQALARLKSRMDTNAVGQ